MEWKRVMLFATVYLGFNGAYAAPFVLSEDVVFPPNEQGKYTGGLHGSKPVINKISATGNYYFGEDLTIDFADLNTYQFADKDLDTDNSIQNFNWYCFKDAAVVLIPELITMKASESEMFLNQLLREDKASILNNQINGSFNKLAFNSGIANNLECQNIGFAILPETLTGYPDRKNSLLIVPDASFSGAIDVEGKPSYTRREEYSLPVNLTTPLVDTSANPFAFPAYPINNPNNFPTTGFKGAVFRINTINNATIEDNQRYTWEIFQLNNELESNTDLATVDSSGNVLLTKEPQFPTVIRVKATLTEPELEANLGRKFGYMYDFQVKTWFDPGLPMPDYYPPKVNSLILSGQLSEGSVLNVSYTYDNNGDTSQGGQNNSVYSFGTKGNTATSVLTSTALAGTAGSMQVGVNNFQLPALQAEQINKVLEISVMAKNKSGIIGNIETIDTSMSYEDGARVSESLLRLRQIVIADNDAIYHLPTSGFPTTGFLGAKFKFLLTNEGDPSDFEFTADQPWVDVQTTPGVVDFIGTKIGNGAPTADARDVVITATHKKTGDTWSYNFSLNRWYLHNQSYQGDLAAANGLEYNLNVLKTECLKEGEGSKPFKSKYIEKDGLRNYGEGKTLADEWFSGLNAGSVNGLYNTYTQYVGKPLFYASQSYRAIGGPYVYPSLDEDMIIVAQGLLNISKYTDIFYNSEFIRTGVMYQGIGCTIHYIPEPDYAFVPSAPEIRNLTWGGIFDIGETSSISYDFLSDNSTENRTVYSYGLKGETNEAVLNSSMLAGSPPVMGENSFDLPPFTAEQVNTVLEVSLLPVDGNNRKGDIVTLDSSMKQSNPGVLLYRTLLPFVGATANGFTFNNPTDHTLNVTSDFPSTGFIGATFTINLPSSEKVSDYTWSSNKTWADATTNPGTVRFIGTPPALSFVTLQIKATHKINGKTRMYTTTIRNWFASGDENIATFDDANNVCTSVGWSLPTMSQVTNDPVNGVFRTPGTLISEWGAIDSMAYPIDDLVGVDGIAGNGITDEFFSEAWVKNDVPENPKQGFNFGKNGILGVGVINKQEMGVICTKKL